MLFRTSPKRGLHHARVYSRRVIDPAQVVAGFSVGTIVGLTGVGGGSLMTPLLVLLFGIHPATAVGTDLLHAAISKAGGTYVHASKRRVEWRISLLLAAGSVPAAILTLVSLHVFTGGLGNAALITTALGIALLFTIGLAIVDSCHVIDVGESAIPGLPVYTRARYGVAGWWWR